MSSTYRILCLSHDPALTFGEFDSPGEAEAAIRSGIDEHPRCDLLIGRYSYPLVEVGCPSSVGRDGATPDRHVVHSVTKWVDAVWLRILAAVHQSGTEQMRALTGESSLSCWQRDRLSRLRGELGLDVREDAS
ncbi:hypothetical protein ACIBHX_01845 [Nonomuraea sp. NPDC050536]|uniref:hypothetical protein n=1 Tax=Nonomuraea sp. NPDC050536 TaxID=3364366 RepID=UPI0037C998B5